MWVGEVVVWVGVIGVGADGAEGFVVDLAVGV